jgi:DNA-binding NarL/FixJ family response regulator
MSRPVILVVDDTIGSLRFVARALEEAGMTALVATDGGQALSRLAHAAPDLILMDAVMPGLDGFETTRRLKAEPASRHIPVVFMTGLADTEHVVRGLEVGGADFLTKPVVVDELLARIRVHLATARVAQGSQSALDGSGRPALAVDAAGRVGWSTPVAGAMLARLFPGWSATSGLLPEPLLDFILPFQANAPEPGACLSVTVGDTLLEAGFLRALGPDQWLFRLSERREGEEERALADRHGLTAREAEVLLWISRGKQNREVSQILHISPRTVNKHLEQIFEKMGVENRASATAIAVTTLAR